MGDDARPGERDSDLASWLEVDPLDEVTRRRLVTTALRESGDPAKRPSRAWRWIAAAAALVIVVTTGVALLTADGGDDEQRANHSDRSSLATGAAQSEAPSIATLPGVGDFGDLDDPA